MLCGVADPATLRSEGSPLNCKRERADLAKHGIGLAGEQAFKFRLRHVEPDAEARLLVVVTVYEWPND
jgi:hypothetical protein